MGIKQCCKYKDVPADLNLDTLGYHQKEISTKKAKNTIYLTSNQFTNNQTLSRGRTINNDNTTFLDDKNCHTIDKSQ